MKVTIVTVTHNSAGVLPHFFAALDSSDFPVVVVDNGSTDQSVEIAREHGAIKILSGKNIGYGRAANRGFSEVRTPYGLLINPDVVMTAETVHKMATCLEMYPDIGMVGAQMFCLDAKGEKKYSRIEIFDQEGLATTDWLVGAAMLIRMEAFRALGGFDENIFLYYEETDLCKRFIKAGYRLVLMRDAESYHEEGTSCAPCARVFKLKYWHAAWSKAYFMRKHSSMISYARMCAARLPNTGVKCIRAFLSGDSTNARKHYYTLRGTIAAVLGRKSFKNGVGRHS